jgi:GNAT superfamily N-acetyltransferase
LRGIFNGDRARSRLSTDSASTTPPSILIRPARLEDAPGIASVQVESWRTTYPGIVAQEFIDSLTIANRTAAWERGLRGETRVVPDVLVAVESGDVIGFASGGPIREPQAGFDGELHAIYLLQAAQGRGTGRRLVREWASTAIARGLTSAAVRALALNPATRFYERLGARRVKEGTCELGDRTYPEVWYGWDDLRVLVK